ncbi:hypothetical protein U1Q18_029636 [Sarracenia purpurea var. burkii]
MVYCTRLADNINNGGDDNGDGHPGAPPNCGPTVGRGCTQYGSWGYVLPPSYGSWGCTHWIPGL